MVAYVQEAGRDLMKKAWGFVQRVEAGGFTLNDARKASDELLLDEFAYSLAETANRICAQNETATLWNAKADGKVVSLDEATPRVP
jgi:hypothetical protein